MPRTVQASDGVATKVAKYVPAEMVTFATAYFAAFDPGHWTLVTVVVIGAVLNVVYLVSVSRADQTADAPQKRFYALSAVAFLLWSASVIDEVADVAHLDTEGKRAFVLTFAAFVLPLLDSVDVSKVVGRQRAMGTAGRDRDG